MCACTAQALCGLLEVRVREGREDGRMDARVPQQLLTTVVVAHYFTETERFIFHG